jgi:hypothetical protein
MSTITLSSEAVAVPSQLLVGGRWLDASDGRTFDVDDPATGAVIAVVADGIHPPRRELRPSRTGGQLQHRGGGDRSGQ